MKKAPKLVEALSPLWKDLRIFEIPLLPSYFAKHGKKEPRAQFTGIIDLI